MVKFLREAIRQGDEILIYANKLMNYNYIEIENFKIFYDNLDAAKSVISGIFNKNYIIIKCGKENPFIIDCGSHIGISVLYFKFQYPDAEIIAFEPDIETFKFLKKNVTANHLKKVTLINKAVALEEGNKLLFGALSNKQADHRGNSLIAEWGQQCENHNEQLLVKTTKLSSYINRAVDFLKLDIEASELQVLKEINDKLDLINELSIEVHLSDKTKDINSLEEILAILTMYNFETTIVEHIISYIPEGKNAWFKENHPSIFMLHSIKKNLC